MEDIEIGLEEQHENLHHAAHREERWLLHCALIAAILAVAAAIAGLYSSHFANEAMMEQIQASNHWGYYQSKGVKAMLTELRGELMESDGKAVPVSLNEKIKGYHEEQQEIKDQALDETNTASIYMQQHETLAKAVTVFQIGIAITAIAAISRRKYFLILTLMLALAGIEFTFSTFWI